MALKMSTTEKHDSNQPPAVSIIQDGPYVVVMSHGRPLLRFENAELVIDDNGLSIKKDGEEITSMGVGRHEAWKAQITGIELTPTE